MPQPGERLIAPAPHVRALGPSANGGYNIDTNDRQAVKLFYRTVFAASNNVSEDWTGSVAACDAGDISPDYRAAVLRRINWFRAMAGVPANIQFDATYNAKAQKAALMMSANNTLNHFPPTSWLCYTADGADAAGHSNLDLGRAGVASVTTGFIRDPGSNNAPVGHRRWELYPRQQYMGIGSVSRAAVLWTLGAFTAERPAVRDDFVAWPPKGYVPYQTVYPRWSLSYPNADFSAATVTMTENGTPIAARLEPVSIGFGENTLVWLPGSYSDADAWRRPAADTTYQVTVSNVNIAGAPRTFSYTTTVFDPDEALDATTVSGPSKLVASQEGSFNVTAAPEESDSQWRSIIGTPFAFTDSAEAGTGSFVVSTSGTYDVLVSGTAASGSHSFRLGGAATDQVLQLRQPLIIHDGSTITFNSRLALASQTQLALLDISSDEGVSWTTVYRQAGAGDTSWGEPSFTAKTVALGAYAGKMALLRFRYSSSGSSYTAATAGSGWYIDDISLQGVDALAWTGAAADTAQGGFTLAASQPGTVYVQGRGRAFGYPLEWGPLHTVAVNAAGADPFDCLLNWAERNYPTVLSPAKATSTTLGAYYYRSYPGTGSYVGLDARDNHVYYLNRGVMQDLGAQDGWLANAGCPRSS